MRSNSLFYRGRAYPGAVARNELGFVIIVPGAKSLASLLAAHVGNPPGFVPKFPVAAGRKWEANEPRGFWMTFCEADRTSPNDAEMITWRYGIPDESDRDPNETLPKRGFSTTTAWITYQNMLGIAARAWEEPSADGVRRLTTDERRLREARDFLGEWPVVTRLVQDRTTGGLIPKADTLADYMMISAAMMLAEGTEMRRCAWCGHWYGLYDQRMQFCSAACRKAAHRAKKQELR